MGSQAIRQPRNDPIAGSHIQVSFGMGDRFPRAVETEFSQQGRAEPQFGPLARMVGLAHGAVHCRHAPAMGNGDADGVAELQPVESDQRPDADGRTHRSHCRRHMPARAVVGAAHGVRQAGRRFKPKDKSPQDGLPAEVALFGNGQQGGEEGRRRVEVRLRGHERIVEVQDMRLLPVDQSGEFGGKPLRPPPDLRLPPATDGAAVVHQDLGGGVIDTAQTDAEPVDDGAPGLMDRLPGDLLIGGLDEKAGEPVSHRIDFFL